MKKAIFILGSINLVAMEKKLKRLHIYVCQTFRKLFFFFADNFTGAEDTKPNKTDISFLCQYTCIRHQYIIQLVLLYLCTKYDLNYKGL